MGGLRMGELLIILVVVLILFGAARLPQLGSSLGQAIKNFKRGFGDGDDSPAAGNRDAGSLSSSNTIDNKDVDRSKSPPPKTA